MSSINCLNSSFGSLKKCIKDEFIDHAKTVATETDIKFSTILILFYFIRCLLIYKVKFFKIEGCLFYFLWVIMKSIVLPFNKMPFNL